MNNQYVFYDIPLNGIFLVTIEKEENTPLYTIVFEDDYKIGKIETDNIQRVLGEMQLYPIGEL